MCLMDPEMLKKVLQLVHIVVSQTWHPCNHYDKIGDAEKRLIKGQSSSTSQSQMLLHPRTMPVPFIRLLWMKLCWRPVTHFFVCLHTIRDTLCIPQNATFCCLAKSLYNGSVIILESAILLTPLKHWLYFPTSCAVPHTLDVHFPLFPTCLLGCAELGWPFNLYTKCCWNGDFEGIRIVNHKALEGMANLRITRVE